MLTFESRMGSIFWACNPISFKRISFLCQFLHPHLTTFHSNIGVQIIVVFNLGTSTLCANAWGLLGECFVLQHQYRLLHGTVCNHDFGCSRAGTRRRGCCQVDWNAAVFVCSFTHYIFVWGFCFLSQLLHILCHSCHHSCHIQRCW